MMTFLWMLLSAGIGYWVGKVSLVPKIEDQMAKSYKQGLDEGMRIAHWIRDLEEEEQRKDATL